MLKKLSQDFDTRLRLHNRGVDVEITNKSITEERLGVFKKMSTMVKDTDK